MLQRYFVQIGWKSGRICYYCATADSGERAIELVTGDDPTRAAEIVAARAWTWEGTDGPRVKLDEPRAFRLRSQATIDAAIDRLSSTMSEARKTGEPPPVATLVRPGISGRMRLQRGIGS